MNIIIIDEFGVSRVESNSISNSVIGQKARGLLKIPVLWRLPFLCISASVFQKFASCDSVIEKKNLLHNVTSNLYDCFPEINVLTNEPIIIRSSGVEEGFLERGRYDSINCSLSRLEETLESIFSGLVSSFDPPPKIAFVVQKFIPNSPLGHLSNERRFSPVKREWVYEITDENSVVQSGKISVRYWRTTYEGVESKELLCNSLPMIPRTLRQIAWYFSKKKIAIHFEFIWDGRRVYLVQADPEKQASEPADNPTSVDITVNNAALTNLKVLKLVSEKDARYKKVKNILLYQRIGLNTAPIYILNSKSYLEELGRGEISPPLEEDLKALVCNSVVVRLDIANADIQDRQLLARSNEIRSYENLRDWLLGQRAFLNSGKDIALLFHIFIPAQGAAFVNATPTGRIVKIEALWGLPEGLYYNTHDKVTVDTRSNNAEIISMKNMEILSKQPGFKEFYIAPNETGQWVQKRTAQPYDWKLCIDDESIKQIAYESRKIAQAENKSVSVMWFLGIDKTYYKTVNLAWFHEEFSKAGYTASEYKKKYFSEAETVIRNQSDFEAFVNDPNVKEITIRPVEDALLRNKDFLREVGEAAVKKGTTIVLEGAVLAHPLYQLCRTGARVLTQSAYSQYRKESNFNKLVRDGIPDMIINNGEDVSCQILERDAFLRALMEKAVEEALEIASASPSEIIEELGDEYEVISCILETVEGMAGIDRFQRKVKTEEKRLFPRKELFYTEQRFSLSNKFSRKKVNANEYGYIDVDVSYESAKLQLELHFYRYEVKGPTSKTCEKLTSDINAEQLFKDALSLTSYSQLRYVKKAANMMLDRVLEMVQIKGVSEEKFLEIVNSKKEKRGGFSKGYVLRSSSLAQEEEYDFDEQLDIPKQEFIKVSYLDYQTVKNADYLDKGNGELVLRISLPICFNEYQTIFDSQMVKKYIGNNTILLSISREKSAISLSLSIQREYDEYQQLTIPL